MEVNTLTTILNNFTAVFTGGFSLLWPSVQWLMWTLAAIEIVLIGLYWALNGGDQILNVFKKVLFFGFWLWLIQNFPTLADAFVRSLASAGLIAGGQAGNTSLIWDPSRIAGYGLDASQPIINEIDALGITDLGQMILLGLATLGILLSFFIVAIQVFITLLEFYLVTTLSLILLPFGFLSHTKFLAEKALGAVISFGVKLMVLSFIVAAAEPTLSSLSYTTTEPTMNEAFAMLLSSGAIAFLAWNAPGIAAGLLTGSPSLSAGAALQNTVAGAAMGGLAVSGGLAATRAAASAGGALTSGATRLAGSASTGYKLGAATSTGGKLAQIGAGTVGAIKAASGSLVQSTVGRANQSVSSAVSRNLGIGAGRGFSTTGGKPTAGMQKSSQQLKSDAAAGGSSSAPAWAQRAMRAMHAIPHEARPAGAGANPKI